MKQCTSTVFPGWNVLNNVLRATYIVSDKRKAYPLELILRHKLEIGQVQKTYV